MGLVGAEELVQLRRLDVRAGQHGVRLSAVVDLVLEQMREEARGRLVHDALAALDGDGQLELRFGERCTRVDQPTVERTDADFNMLGISFRGYIDFGVREQDYRGALKVKGES